MLIICNGAFKSGSTWLFVLLRSIVASTDIPEEYRINGDWNGQTIAEELLPDFLDRVDCHTRNYIFKTHWTNPETLATVVRHDDVIVCNIVRDLRDVLVSAFHHFKRLGSEPDGFADFYARMGSNLIWGNTRHHHLWQSRPGKVHVASYEGLLNHFDDEASRLMAFLNQKASPKRLARLRQATTLDSLRTLWGEADKPADERFFRKGTTDDWVNHFTPEITRNFSETVINAQRFFASNI